MTTNVSINKMLETNVPSTSIDGDIIFSEQGNLYIYSNNGTKTKVSDIIPVSSLPTTGLTNKLYILTSDYSLNYYDISWHSLDSQTGINAWMNGENYKIGDLVIYNNGIYQCKNTNSDTTFTTTNWNSIGGNATSINNINIDNTTLNNGMGLFYNQSLNKFEWADVTVSGIVGSTQITTIENTTIGSGMEQIFNHPTSTNIVPVIEEQIVGSSFSDTHVDFNDNSKYVLQDSGKILIGGNKAQLNIYPKLLMHMDDSGFIDVCGNTVTNNGVTLDSINKVFGTGSAYFNGSSYLSVSDSNDFNFGTGDFTIQFKLSFSTMQTGNVHLIGHFSSALVGWYICMNQVGQGYLSFYNNNNSNVLNTSSSVITQTNKFYDIALIRNNGVLTFYIDGIAKGSTTYSSSIQPVSHPLWIGTGDYSGHTYLTSANIDEVLLSNKAIYNTNFTPLTSAYGEPYKTINTPIYLQTTGLSNYGLTTVDTITSLTIPITTTVNSTVKCLFSVDNKQNWLYYNGTSIQKFTGDIEQDWNTTSSSYIQLQNLFTNLSITAFITMLSSLSIVPVTLDFCFQLNSTSLSETPSVSTITMVYTTTPHSEFASIGSFNDSSTYGIKRVSNGSLSVKNKSAVSKTIKLNIITSV